MKKILSEATFSILNIEWMMGVIFFQFLFLFTFFFMYIRYLKKRPQLNRNVCYNSGSNDSLPDDNAASTFRESLYYRIQSAKSIIDFKHSSIRPLSQKLKTLRIYENSLFVHDREMFIALMDKSFYNLHDRLSDFRINHEEFVYCSLVLLSIPEGEIRHILQLTKSDLHVFEKNLSAKFNLNGTQSLKEFIFTYHPDYTNK